MPVKTPENIKNKSQQEKINGCVGCVNSAYEMTLKAENGHCQMLAACNGIESMAKIVGSFMTKHAEEIKNGTLTVFQFCSGKVLSDGSVIETVTCNGKKLIEDNERENKKLIWGEIFRLAEEKKNFVIFHVQMLGVGTDLPCLNSVVILGDKNETDLFQTIMRGCRVDDNNPEKKDYHVFIYVPDEVKAYMKKFIDTLDKLGGPELIKAFSNDCLQGEAVHNSDPLFSDMLMSRAAYNQVVEEYNQIVNCSEYNKNIAVNVVLQKYLTYLSEGKKDEAEIMRNMWLKLTNNLYLNT